MADQPVQPLTLRFRNRSGNTLDFLCFQKFPELKLPGIQLLAWFAKPVADGADCDFAWTLTCDFVWREIGHLASEIAFQSQQVVPADLAGANHIVLTHQDGAFAFGKPNSGEQPHGSLAIACDATIPVNEVAVGFGMAGAPVVLAPAQPNTTFVFAPHPEYWITAGKFTSGEVLDVASLTAPVSVPFPVNIDKMTATLDGSGKWTLEPGLS